MISSLKVFCLACACAWLAACGFTPMYAQPESSQILFSELQVIDRSPGQHGTQRTGYHLSTALQERLTAANAPNRSASIIVWLTEQTVNLGVQSTDAASRKDLYLTVRYEFTPAEVANMPSQTLRGTFTSVATYNLSGSPYAEIAALQDARNRAAEDMADRIAREISFKSKKAK